MRLNGRIISEESQADENTMDVGWSRDMRTDDLIDESVEVDWSYETNEDGTETFVPASASAVIETSQIKKAVDEEVSAMNSCIKGFHDLQAKLLKEGFELHEMLGHPEMEELLSAIYEMKNCMTEHELSGNWLNLQSF
jgi:hypothetical protein